MKNLGVDFTFTLEIIFYRGKNRSFMFHYALNTFKVSLKSEFFELDNFSRKFRPRGNYDRWRFPIDIVHTFKKIIISRSL